MIEEDEFILHDTAFHIGTLAMNIYADLRTDAILDVGSQAVNGSLRDNVLPTTKYVGVDIEEGQGVDLLVEPGKPLPVEDDSFDLVMASSVFEHDPCFWMTFLEMCRAAKDGGYIYINAPSNGVVHRYPQDNWRFYPDSGKALAQWAASQGRPVTLVESFIANRESDIWNDFVAVFRKGPIKKKLPDVFLHEHVPCTDILTWKSKEVVNPSEQPEDMIRLARAEERAGLAEERLNRAVTERDELCKQLADLESVRSELNLRQSELRQRQEEIEQTRSQLQHEAALRQEAETAAASWKKLYERENQELQDRNEELEHRARAGEAALEQLKQSALAEQAALEERAEELEERARALQAKLDQSRSEKKLLEKRLDERFKEIATLSTLLADAESREQGSREDIEWLREVGTLLVDGSGGLKERLLTFLPAAIYLRRQRQLLKRKGFFDGASYLAAHPDVEADRADPLRHYLKHGIVEKRPRA